MRRLRNFLADEGAILDAIRDEHADGAGQNRLIRRGRQIAEELGTLVPDRVRTMLMTLISRIDIRPDCIEISAPSVPDPISAGALLPADVASAAIDDSSGGSAAKGWPSDFTPSSSARASLRVAPPGDAGGRGAFHRAEHPRDPCEVDE